MFRHAFADYVTPGFELAKKMERKVDRAIRLRNRVAKFEFVGQVVGAIFEWQIAGEILFGVKPKTDDVGFICVFLASFIDRPVALLALDNQECGGR